MTATRTFPRTGETAARLRTENQVAFLKDLVSQIAKYDRERGVELWTQLRKMDPEGNPMTFARASDTIAALKAERGEHRMGQHVDPAEDRGPSRKLPDVPEGRYSVRTDDGPLGFYLVRLKGGRYTVKVYASDALRELPWTAARGVLRKIEADGPEAAALRFGQESKRCYKCGQRLTQEHTRAAGVGDECASK